MSAVDDANEVDGLLIADAAGVFSGGNDPWIDVPNAPRGSIYLHTGGLIWHKTGESELAAAWITLGGSNPATVGKTAVRLLADAAGVTVTGAGTTLAMAAGGYETAAAQLRQNPANINQIEALTSLTLLVLAQANINSPSEDGRNVEVLAKLCKNGQLIPGSETDLALFSDGSIPGDIHDGTVHNFAVVDVVAGDVIELMLVKLEHGGGTSTITTEGQGTLSAFAIGGQKGDKGDKGNKGDLAPGAAIFGSEYQYVESVPVVTTLSTTFQSKVKLTTPVIPAGKYRTEVSYQWNHDSTSSDFEAKLTHNGADIWLHKQEPKDSSGSYSSTRTSQRYQFEKSGTFDLPSQIHNLELWYRSDDDEDESSIWDASITFYRVA